MRTPRTKAAAFPAVAVLAVALAAVTIAHGAPALADAAAPAYRLVVNPGNAATAVDRRFVADVFLKKVTRWPQDLAARPVDLADDSPVRRRFSEDVLKRSVPAVKAFWQQAIFSGRNVPPPEVDSDQEVIKFVLRNAGGIGYVSGTASLEGAKVVVLR